MSNLKLKIDELLLDPVHHKTSYHNDIINAPPEQFGNLLMIDIKSMLPGPLQPFYENKQEYADSEIYNVISCIDGPKVPYWRFK